MTKEQEEAILILKRIKMGIKADTQTPNVNVRDVARKKVKAIETVLSMLEEKDKQIDLMAELIARKAGARIEICHNMHCKENSEIECKKCAKEYFLNIVKKEE